MIGRRPHLVTVEDDGRPWTTSDGSVVGVA